MVLLLVPSTEQIDQLREWSCPAGLTKASCAGILWARHAIFLSPKNVCLGGWFDHRVNCFSYKEVQLLKIVLPACENQLPWPAENILVNPLLNVFLLAGFINLLIQINGMFEISTCFIAIFILIGTYKFIYNLM